MAAAAVRGSSTTTKWTSRKCAGRPLICMGLRSGCWVARVRNVGRLPRAHGSLLNDPARSDVLYGATPHGEDRSRRHPEPMKEWQVESSQREAVLQGLHDRHAPE